MKPFTINIPIYNEEEILTANINKLVQFLERLKTEYEIIIVSNGSTDRTCELGRTLQEKNKNIKFFHLAQRGVGLAFRKALLEASFDHIISLDIDLSFDLSFIKEANTLLDECAIVIGSKISGTQKRGLLRKAGSGIYIYFVKLLLGINLHDFSIGAKGFKKSFVLNNLDCMDDYTSYVLNLSFRAHKQGEKIIEIPVNCEDFRKSRFNLITEAIYRFAMLFKLVFSSQ